MQINCLEPTIIVNPLLNELVAMHGNYTLFGKSIKLFNFKKLLYEFQAKDIKCRLSDVTMDNIDNHYVVDCVTGEHYPVYLQVPCGHCEICTRAKVNALVDRCRLETQLYKSKPIFLTLTYDENHVPQTGVCLRDVQNFFKRLRINLYRRGYREKIRYLLVAEYGKRPITGKCPRPHYHAILWNLHQSDILSYIEIGKIIQASWHNGFEMHRLVDPSDDKAFYYTAKYLHKGSYIPDGCNKTFMVCSNRGGAIGARFYDTIKNQAIKHLNTDIKYVNKWNGRVYSVMVSRYMLNRLLPSLSRSLPYSLKCRVKRFMLDYAVLRYRNNDNHYLFDIKFRNFFNYFSKHFFLYVYPDGECVRFLSIDKRSDESILKEMLQDEIYIDEFYKKSHSYFEDAIYIDGRRKTYIVKLFEHVTFQNLKLKAHLIRKDVALSLQRCIL